MGRLDDLRVGPLAIARRTITAPVRPAHGLGFKPDMRREFRS
jgi:hypothetical protein